MKERPDFPEIVRTLMSRQGLGGVFRKGRDLDLLETFAKYVQSTGMSTDDAILRLQVEMSSFNATTASDNDGDREERGPPTPTPVSRTNGVGRYYYSSDQNITGSGMVSTPRLPPTSANLTTPDYSHRLPAFLRNEADNISNRGNYPTPDNLYPLYGNTTAPTAPTAPRDYSFFGMGMGVGMYDNIQNLTPPKDDDPKDPDVKPPGQSFNSWNMGLLCGLDNPNHALSSYSSQAPDAAAIHQAVSLSAQNPAIMSRFFPNRESSLVDLKSQSPFTPPGSLEKLQKHQQQHHVPQPSPQGSGFRPMQAVLDAPARNAQSQLFAHDVDQGRAASAITATTTPAAAAAGSAPIPAELLAINHPNSSAKFSNRYFGMHTQGNASAEHLSNDQNCALWLRNLPPNVTYHQLLSSIRGIGRIWCTFINTPDYVTHNTAAAKVVFFTPAAAGKFLRHVETTAPSVRGFPIKADHNRIKYGENSLASGVSRVLIITGEAWFVNEASLTAWFAEMFVFQVDEVIEIVSSAGRAVVEFRFGSYRCQAQMGKMSLERNMPKGFQWAEFGNDPCEMGETLDSYRTATQRIQGISPKV